MGVLRSSDYAIAAVGAIEGQYYRKYGKLVPFSVQQLIDCSTDVGNQGCSGGYVLRCKRTLQK